MGVNNVAGLVGAEQFADSFACYLVQCGDIQAGQNTRQIDLGSSVPPDLCDNTCVRAYRHVVAVQGSQHCPNIPVALVRGYAERIRLPLAA